MYQSSFNFFECDAGVSATLGIHFDARCRTVEQLLRSQTSNDDEAKPGVDSRPGPFIRYSGQPITVLFFGGNHIWLRKTPGFELKLATPRGKL